MMKKQQKPHRNSQIYQSPARSASPPSKLAFVKPHRWLVYVLLFLLAILVWLVWSGTPTIQRQSITTQNKAVTKKSEPTSGQVVEQGEITTYSAEQTIQLIRQTNKAYTGPSVSIKTQTFRYTVSDKNGQTFAVYARVFMPNNDAKGSLPVFAFSPGTTGIDDQCASSLEQSSRRAWGNYPSHMASYATQGFITVITDYEGMRDEARMHHYMVGELEGRAVLDAIRALKNLSLTKSRADLNTVIVGGYSQGGHSSYWADEIATSYAPEVSIGGVVGFGPVTDVRRTLTDTTRGANILWFGPYVLYSYSDWYREKYPLEQILMPPYSSNLANDIAKNCIDTNIAYWGNKNIDRVYTPQFINDMKTGSVASTSEIFDKRLQENLTADKKTASKKAIFHGQQDNVVLPAQSDDAFKRLCGLGNEVTSLRYADATHYTTMVRAYNDAVNWMKSVVAGRQVANNCL